MAINSLNKDYLPCLQELDKLGFCTFPLFNKKQVDQLHQLYVENFNKRTINSLYASHNSNPVKQSLHVSEEIKKIVNEPLQIALSGYKYFLGHFMVKGANVEREFSLHQDWNIVDESKYKSYQVWIPLQLSYPGNGGIFVVPGSHKFFNNYRSGSYGIPVIPFDENVKSIVTDLILPPGNVLVYHNGLFHASHSNLTNELRIAVIVNFVEEVAPTFFFHKNEKRNTTELYSITGDTLISNLPNLEKGIVGNHFTLISTLPMSDVDNSQITSSVIASKYRKHMGETPAPQIKQLHITVAESLEYKLNNEGYAIIDLLNEKQIETFKQEYYRRFSDISRTPGRFTTLQSANSVIKKQINEFILAQIDEPLRKYFKDYIIPIALYYTKKAHTSGDIELHADSTLLLNHQLEPHYAIWVPLVDVNNNNGTLTVIPYSHLVSHAIFNGTFQGYHREHTLWLKQHEIPLNLKAGQAVIFDNNLLHNSTANQTDADRICFTFRLTHYSSKYYSLMGNANKTDVDVYEETHNFYLDDNWDGERQSSEAKHIGTLRNSIPKILDTELKKILHSSTFICEQISKSKEL